MRQLQTGAKIAFEEAIVPESDMMEALVTHDCFVSTTDMFGVTVFVRLAHIINKIDAAVTQKSKK